MEMRDKKKWSDRVGNVFKASGKPWDDSVKMAIKAKLAGMVAAKPETALAIQKRGVIDNLGQTLLDKLGSLPTDKLGSQLERGGLSHRLPMSRIFAACEGLSLPILDNLSALPTSTHFPAQHAFRINERARSSVRGRLGRHSTRWD